ncbi:NeuD/PglB/VioB family sugar acetyltransferase [Paracoccaceae bacterium Fryx2]|nr:NeuD/PglB/VioB family sugar acetyltransferase [Paracoccaceae bacterium Fryx2]
MPEMQKAPLVVIGFNGNALDALETLQSSFEIVAWLDDNPALHGRRVENAPILPMSDIAAFPDAQVVCMIGSERSYPHRHDIVARLGLPDTRFATIVDPAARVSRLCLLGHGAVVFPGVVITSNAVIGNHVMLLPQTVVHHDAVVGDYSLLGSGVVVAGSVKVGRACYIGSGSTIRNGLAIGDGSLVGMAANVLRDVAPGSVVAGNPARLLRRV